MTHNCLPMDNDGPFLIHIYDTRCNGVTCRVSQFYIFHRTEYLKKNYLQFQSYVLSLLHNYMDIKVLKINVITIHIRKGHDGQILGKISQDGLLSTQVYRNFVEFFKHFFRQSKL